MKNKQTKFDPFKNLVLDKYEQEIEDALERGEYEPVSKEELKKTQEFFQEAARNTLEELKSKRVSVRVRQGDLNKLKARARQKNIPYQTLLNLIIRAFVNGEFSVKL